MSATNSTTNYELSQFIGTDKPAWLSDYNGDMAKIDAGIHTAQTTATASDGKADANTTKIGDLTYLSTTAKTNLVAAINEVDSNAETAQNTANSASSTANTANLNITALQNYLTMSSITNYNTSNLNITSGGGTLGSSSNITVVKNASGTLCKIYGDLIVNQPTSNSAKIKLNVDTGIHPQEKITITNTGFIENIPQSWGLTGLNIDINTDGTIEFYGGTGVGSDTTYHMRLIACLIFVENFGDEPEAQISLIYLKPAHRGGFLVGWNYGGSMGGCTNMPCSREGCTMLPCTMLEP